MNNDTTGTTDTIAAIASASGAAGVGVVRISGPQAPTIAQALLRRQPRPRHAHLTAFCDSAGKLIDHGLLLYFPAPASYTGENVVELQGHGNRVLLDGLLRRVFALGARLARPGEFTERAFLNGKLDLTQAEAVADLIAARSQVAARAAQRSLQGVFARRVDGLLQALVVLRVHIEAAIDFAEEEIDFLADSAITRQLQDVRRLVDNLLEEVRRGVRLTDGLSVVIVGRPNVGKSSLLNALAGDERAIVTPIAGTTRDAVREMLDIDGVGLELIDTAGLRDGADEVEREGVRRARAHLQRADVALLISDAQHADIDQALLAELPSTTPRLTVVNKVDLTRAAAHSEMRDDGEWLWLSAKTGAGLDTLRQRLCHFAGAGDTEDGAFSARRRHLLALENVAVHLHRAARSLDENAAGELAAEDLRQAQHALGEITGEYHSDDLLGAVFSSFCIGK